MFGHPFYGRAMPAQTEQRGVIVGGSILGPGNQDPVPGALSWEGDRITTVDLTDCADPNAGTVVDATGCLVLPGIIDLHGDAFERSLMPRAGVPVSLGTAMADNDMQLLAAGITTSFLSATDSWEPGLRSRETLRALVTKLRRRPPGPRLLLHVRHERCQVDDLDELLGWLADGTVSVLSYNDHTPGGIAHVTGVTSTQVARSGVDEQELLERLELAMSRRPTGVGQESLLAAAAATAGIVTASHDPSTASDLDRDLELNIGFVEFPTTIELAHQYRASGVPVLLGAPNLVRGGSHLGNLAVLDAVAAGAVDLLCSDYHYPSLLEAPFVVTAKGLLGLGDAWAMVSGAVAEAVGLSDRGRLEPGLLADAIVLEPPASEPPRVRAVVVGGQVVHTRA